MASRGSSQYGLVVLVPGDLARQGYGYCVEIPARSSEQMGWLSFAIVEAFPEGIPFAAIPLLRELHGARVRRWHQPHGPWLSEQHLWFDEQWHTAVRTFHEKGEESPVTYLTRLILSERPDLLPRYPGDFEERARQAEQTVKKALQRAGTITG